MSENRCPLSGLGGRPKKRQNGSSVRILVFSIRLFYLPVSHHTGNIGSLVRSLSAGNYRAFCYTGLVVFCFFVGSFFSGLIFHKQKFELKRRYGLFLMGFAAAFFMLFLITPFRILQVYVTACILGMQNGLFIYYDGIVVRTTHLTGSLTDAALALAASIRGNEPKKRFAAFYLINIGSFFCGGDIVTHGGDASDNAVCEKGFVAVSRIYAEVRAAKGVDGISFSV